MLQRILQGVQDIQSSKKSRSGSRSNQNDYEFMLEFRIMDSLHIFNSVDIANVAHHKSALKEALIKMTKSILAAKSSSKRPEMGDETQVVQVHLDIFLQDILPVAEAIIRLDDTSSSSSSSSNISSSSSSIQLPNLSVTRERPYKIDGTKLFREEHRPITEGSSDFSIHHKEFKPYALTLFEAKKTQVQLGNVTSAEVKEHIAQAGIQMMGEIQQLKDFGHVSKYRSMLTNGLVWIHVFMCGRDTEGRMIWRHSPPLEVAVAKKGRGQKNAYDIDSGAIDIVVDHLLITLVTANSVLRWIKQRAQALASDTSTVHLLCNFCFMHELNDFSHFSQAVIKEDRGDEEDDEEDKKGDHEDHDEKCRDSAKKRLRREGRSNNSHSSNNSGNKRQIQNRSSILLPLNEYTLGHWASRMVK